LKPQKIKKKPWKALNNSTFLLNNSKFLKL
jgi:hypothetical protein